MNKYDSNDSINTIHSQDSAYFSDTNNESNPIILELLAMVKKLSLDMAELKEKVCHQETIPSAFPPTPKSDNESQTNDLTCSIDNDETKANATTSDTGNETKYKIQIPETCNETSNIDGIPTQQSNVPHKSASSYIPTTNIDNYVGILKAETIRMSNGDGRRHTHRHLKTIEQFD